MTAGVVAVTVQFWQEFRALWTKSKNRSENCKEFVSNSLAKVNELLKLRLLFVDHLVVQRGRVAITLDVSTADPVLFIVVTGSLFIYNRSSQSLVSVR